MHNLFHGTESQNFHVWINPDNWLVKHQLQQSGEFFSGKINGGSNLLFIPNPDFHGETTPFQMNIMNKYAVEYNFEVFRERHFNRLPSRLSSIFLLPDKEHALRYHDRHLDHVNGRVLRQVFSKGEYTYSVHDSSWVDFMREGNFTDTSLIETINQYYWQGISVDEVNNKQLSALPNWHDNPIPEVLYIGRISFNKAT